MKTKSLPSVEDVSTKIDSRVVHALQTRTISTKGQSTEYRKGLRDMRYIVMEELKSTAVDEITQDRNHAYTRLVEEINKAIFDNCENYIDGTHYY